MSDVREAITNANATVMEAFSRGDAAGFAQAYTAEGQVLPPGSKVITGRADIAAFWAGAAEMGLTSVKIETVELDELGDTAIEIGHYALGTADGAVAEQGKYLVVWKNVGGAWKIHRDIWNPNAAPAG